MLWRKKKSRATGSTESMLEQLEPRAMLYQTPMATGFIGLSQLQDRNNSVVRIITNVGRVDIELFEGTTVAVANNFRNYITSGKYDESFFHSRASGVLQGGGYKFEDGVGLSTISALAPISNGFSFSNLTGTIAMVPINSTQATSQFIFNLQDNPQLNTQSGGFTVFGRVIQGLNILTTIASYTTRDLNQALTGNGTGPFTAVPTTPAYNPVNGPTEATLVKIIDIETIKAPGAAGYYSNTYVYSEGFRSATTTERLDFVNQDTDNTNYFQVIVRYESGDRDAVIYTGSIPAGGRFSLKINDAAIPGLNLVRSNVGYAFDVRATRKMGVALDHRDTGVTLGESFLMTPNIPTPQFTRYLFSYAEKGALFRTYLLVEELAGTNSTINVLIYPASGGQVYIPINVEAFRRGGLNLGAFSQIPDGDFSMYVTCLNPFMASVSQYKTGGGGNASDGATSQGVQGLGRVEGALAGAYLATNGEAEVDVFYPGSTSIVIVDFTITLTNGTILTPSPVTLTQSLRRASLNLANVTNLPRDQYFTIQYSERQGVNPVAATYRSDIAGDKVETPFQINTTTNVTFADGYTDPTLVGTNGMSETISIFNPYASQNVNFFYQFIFHFNDPDPNGRMIFAPANPLSLAPLARRDHKAADFSNVLAKINSNAAYRFYSIQVIAVPFAIPVPVGGVVAQLTRIHNTWGQSLTTIPGLDPSKTVVYMDNVEFNPDP